MSLSQSTSKQKYLAVLLCLSLISAGFFIYQYRQRLVGGAELPQPLVFTPDSPAPESGVPPVYVNDLQAQLERAQSEIDELEVRLEVLRAEPPDPGFDAIAARAEAEALDEFLVAYPAYASATSPSNNPRGDLQYRVAQDLTMRRIGQFLPMLGIDPERIDAMLEDLVASEVQVSELRSQSRYDDSITAEDYMPLSSVVRIREFLSQEEMSRLSELQREQQRLSQLYSLEASLMRQAPELNASERQNALNLYNEAIMAERNTPTVDRFNLRLETIEQVRTTMRDQYTGATLNGMERWLDNQYRMQQFTREINRAVGNF